MTLEELKEDLNKKCPVRYFTKPLIGEDIFDRRSFDDLFAYYKNKKVTEEKLLKALVECGFSAKICRDIKKAVFFKLYKPQFKFWAMSNGATSISGYGTYNIFRNTKYTWRYLNKLYDKIYEKK